MPPRSRRLVQLYLSMPQCNAAGRTTTLDLLDNIAGAEHQTVDELRAHQFRRHAAGYRALHADRDPVITSLNSLGIRNVYQLVENPGSPARYPALEPDLFSLHSHLRSKLDRRHADVRTAAPTSRPSRR